MAKLDGNLGFTGSLGNISAYKKIGTEGIVLRSKGGPSGNKVKHHPAFVNTRRNNNEFGGASSAAKAIRDAFYPVKHMSGSSVGNINKFTGALAKLDTINPWGRRAVRFSENRPLLEGFNLNKNLSLSSILRQPVNASINRNAGSASLMIPALVPGINFKLPPDYKLYRFVAMLTVIADLEHALPVQPWYRPMAPVTYPTQTYITDWFAAKEKLPEKQVDLQLTNFTGLPNCQTLLLGLGIEFGLPISNRLVETIAKTGAAIILAAG
jgi:hypothetical protein